MQLAAVRSHKYRPDIDGLRAIAVMAVVAFHAFPNLVKGGFVGVDVFFVISGYLISGIIIEALRDQNFSYADFYARRIRRIFPALVTVSAVTLAVGWYVLLPDEFKRLGMHLTAGAGFVSNFLLWNEAGYFDTAAETKPLLHLWSLGVEEQFYILWPIILGVAWTRKRGILGIMLVIAAVSFAINAATVTHYPVAAFYSPLSRFWELMIGGILAYLVIGKNIQLHGYENCRCAAGLLLICVGIFALNKEFAFPGYWALLPTLGAFLVISTGGTGWISQYLLGNRLMVAVGLISYPLYLWHWPVLVFSKILKGQLLTPTERVTAIAVSIALAFVTYRFIERPLRANSNFKASRRLALGMGVVAAIGLAAFTSALSSRLKTEHVAQILAASYDWEYPPASGTNYSLGSLRYFELPNKPTAYTLFIGDSNMEQYGPRIDRAIKDRPAVSNGAILVGNQQGCSLLNEIFTGDSRCPKAMTQLHSIASKQDVNSVVIAASWINYGKSLADPEAIDRFAAFLTSLAVTKRVYVILNTPNGDELSPANMFQGSRLERIVPKPLSTIGFDLGRFRDTYGPINLALRAAAKKSGSLIIDPIETLCPQDECPVFDDTGRPLYLDAAHLNRTYAARAAIYIDKTLEPFTPEKGVSVQ